MMDENSAKRMSYSVIAAAWLAVFCLFGYRATFAVLSGPMAQTMKWTGAEVSLGYSLMMTIYAITAFFSGMILDKWGTKPVYAIAAVFGMLVWRDGGAGLRRQGTSRASSSAATTSA